METQGKARYWAVSLWPKKAGNMLSASDLISSLELTSLTTGSCAASPGWRPSTPPTPPWAGPASASWPLSTATRTTWTSSRGSCRRRDWRGRWWGRPWAVSSLSSSRIWDAATGSGTRLLTQSWGISLWWIIQFSNSSPGSVLTSWLRSGQSVCLESSVRPQRILLSFKGLALTCQTRGSTRWGDVRSRLATLTSPIGKKQRRETMKDCVG